LSTLKNVLFVCHGNINRSAAAHIILEALCLDCYIQSAALKDTKGGELITLKMRKALELAGYPTRLRRSVPINAEMVEWASIVFYMDNANYRKLMAKFPESVTKFKPLYEYIPGSTRIADPQFGKGIIEHQAVVKHLTLGITNWLQEQNEESSLSDGTLGP